MASNSIPRTVKRGYYAAKYEQAWRGGRGWIVAASDKYGPHTCRPATAAEVAGIMAFYREYAPGLRVAA
jgi:hypothetical protein